MTRDELLSDLLQRTSRTFALAIPLLPDGLRQQVGLGYLLFRIADTLEDAELLGRDARREELRRYVALLESPGEAEAQRLAQRWSATPASTNADYNRLLAHTADVIAALNDLPADSRDALVRHAIRSAEGMSETLAGADEAGSFRLVSVDDLRRYCYFVAGIVGEMLTELFRLRLAPSPAAEALAEHAAAFGEGLQLVNILKDSSGDAEQGRVYLPPGVPREGVFAIAREDLARAATYGERLAKAGAPEGVLAFVTVPRLLAEGTLEVLECGDRGKLNRTEVAHIMAAAEGEIARLTGADRGASV
ncbi:MAG: squalene/phytoene synthase family protein [Lacipirellulaceae bacterium]